LDGAGVVQEEGGEVPTREISPLFYKTCPFVHKTCPFDVDNVSSLSRRDPKPKSTHSSPHSSPTHSMMEMEGPMC